MYEILKKYFIAFSILLFVICSMAVFFLGYFYLLPSPAEFSSIGSMAINVFNQCKSSTRSQAMNKETCYAKAMQTVAKNHGHEDAFAILFALQKQDPDAIGCHFISHGIGYGAYERNPNDWRQIIRTINRACNYGAVHGTIEKYTTTLPNGLTKEIIPTICGSQPLADCNHIIGHLILVKTRGDINSALDLCNIFENSVQEEFCLSGVFMEEVTALNLIDHGYAPKTWLDWPSRVDSLEALCRSYTGEPAIACWTEIVHAVITKFHNDASRTFAFCNKSPIQEGANKCRYHAIGIIAAASHFDLPNLKQMCLIPQPHDPNFEKNCYIQLAASTLSTSQEKMANVIEFCNSIPQAFRSVCLSQSGQNLNAD